jgi:hypothetical protein
MVHRASPACSSHAHKLWMFTAVRCGMVVSSVIYLPLVLSADGAPQWSAPWRPSAGASGLWVAAGIITLLFWVDGWLLQPWLSRRKLRAPTTERAREFEGSAFGRFLVRACCFYTGAPLGAALSFQAHDSRYSIIGVALSALLILLLRRPHPADAVNHPA